MALLNTGTDSAQALIHFDHRTNSCVALGPQSEPGPDSKETAGERGAHPRHMMLIGCDTPSSGVHCGGPLCAFILPLSCINTADTFLNVTSRPTTPSSRTHLSTETEKTDSQVYLLSGQKGCRYIKWIVCHLTAFAGLTF